MAIARTLLSGLLLPALSAGGGPSRALPSPQTLHKRVLSAQVICIARCTATKTKKQDQPPQPAGIDGKNFTLAIREVLLDRGVGSLQGYVLNNLIPGSSMMGQTHPVPTDVDVVVFARRGAFGKRLSLLSFCLNSVVPLRGVLEEYPGPKYQKQKIGHAEFVAQLRKLLRKFADFQFLRAEFEQAMGSRHPFTAHDKPALLRWLLALADPRVEVYAVALRDADPPEPCRAVLEQYFVRTGKLKVLRETFDGLLQAYRDGELEGTEMFRFANGAMNPRRPRRERLLDAARNLHAAQDTAHAARRLLPLLRAGDSFPARFLIRVGDEEALVATLRVARDRDGTAGTRSAAIRTLAGADEAAAFLAALRLTLEIADAGRRAGLLADLRRAAARHRVPTIPTAAGRGDWQACWRAHAANWPRAFPRGTVDQHLGTEDGWQ